MREYQQILLPDIIGKIKISSLPDFDYGDYDMTDPKQLAKYFFRVEQLCRGSHTYKKLIQFLREYSHMDSCSFYKNINNTDTRSIKIHVHHEPLTLFDIVNIIYAKRLANHEDTSEDAVAHEVMMNHYKMMVGLIPLSETVHELVHNGFLFVPTTKVFGYYKTFMQQYDPYIDSKLKMMLANNEQASLNYDFQKETKILNISTTYIDTTGAYELPQTESVIRALKTKIERIDQALVLQQEL